jgi:hypothetical protein
MSDTKGGGNKAFLYGDPRTIDLSRREERAYWCKSLMIDEAVLEAAVKAVGNSAEQVKRWLAARRSDPR